MQNDTHQVSNFKSYASSPFWTFALWSENSTESLDNWEPGQISFTDLWPTTTWKNNSEDPCNIPGISVGFKGRSRKSYGWQFPELVPHVASPFNSKRVTWVTEWLNLSSTILPFRLEDTKTKRCSLTKTSDKFWPHFSVFKEQALCKITNYKELVIVHF